MYCLCHLLCKELLLGWNTEYVYIVSARMLAYYYCWTKTEAVKYKQSYAYP